jgi:hypothetical protein
MSKEDILCLVYRQVRFVWVVWVIALNKKAIGLASNERPSDRKKTAQQVTKAILVFIKNISLLP